MSKDGIKTGGRNFKPGVSGNPNGAPKIPDEIKEARKLNKIQVEEILNKFLNWPLSDLVLFTQKKESPVLEVLVARILLEGIKKGDQVRLEFIFQRLVGKVKEEIDLNANLNHSFHSRVVDLIDSLEKPNTTEVSHGNNKEAGKEEDSKNKKD